MKRYFMGCLEAIQNPKGDFVRFDDVEAELSRLRAVNAELVEALRGIFEITDRDHVAWHKAHAALRHALAEQVKPETETCVWVPIGAAWFRDCSRAISLWEPLPEICPGCGKRIEVKK